MVKLAQYLTDYHYLFSSFQDVLTTARNATPIITIVTTSRTSVHAPVLKADAV